MAVLKSLQDLASHSVPELSWRALFIYLAQKELKSRSPGEKKRNRKTATKSVQEIYISARQIEVTRNTISHENTRKTGSNDQSHSKDQGHSRNYHATTTSTQLAKHSPSWLASEPTAQNYSTIRKRLKASLRKSIIHPNAFCQHKDLTSGKVCGGTRYLQADHIQPVWEGGTNQTSNLQVLCSNHNGHRYNKQSGAFPQWKLSGKKPKNSKLNPQKTSRNKS